MEVAVEQVRVALQATDPLSHAGLASYLQSRAELTLLRGAQRTDADVLVVAAERLTAEVVAALRRAAAEISAPVVLVTNEITETELLTAVECRVVAILPRPAVTAERLVHSVLAAAGGGGVMPPNLVGELLKHIERLQRDVLTPYGLNASGLTPREIDVLRLMADGLDTNEIAGRLCYSERTVKNVIYGVTHRLKLRNRSHAVAYALRSGMI
jgi:DNA-binding NarL/FixJ family response regulator